MYTRATFFVVCVLVALTCAEKPPVLESQFQGDFEVHAPGEGSITGHGYVDMKNGGICLNSTTGGYYAGKIIFNTDSTKWTSVYSVAPEGDCSTVAKLPQHILSVWISWKIPSDATNLGTKIIGQYTCTGWHYDGNFGVTRTWVDQKTSVPIKMELQPYIIYYGSNITGLLFS